MKIGQTVRVYRNLNNGLLAIRGMDSEKVLGYCNSIVLKDVKTKVGKGTAATIKRKFEETGKSDRNVHAYVIGTIVSINDSDDFPNYARAITYNPLRCDYFTYRDNGSEFVSSGHFAAIASPKGTPLFSIVW